ncbi:MAG: nucleotidyl transferase AbiEii/AbiGii toxin family protein, partial [Dokdonella sp.]
MDELARLARADRAAVFTVAAAEQGLPTHIVEKDFWVCWMLKRLFEPDLVPGMVFKGGTSLSKGWNAIPRFSEDVDLTLPRTGLPETAGLDPSAEMSNTKRGALVTQLKEELAGWCAGAGMRTLEKRIEAALGRVDDWKIEAGGADGDTLWFHYPRGIDGYDYIAPSVRLEFGARMPVQPWQRLSIRPFCASAGEYSMPSPDVGVRVLAPERTFWEKATLIHQVNNRPAHKVGDRVSRHFADLASLWSSQIGKDAMDHLDLLATVAEEKEMLYPSPVADYPAAGRGQLRLT